MRQPFGGGEEKMLGDVRVQSGHLQYFTLFKNPPGKPLFGEKVLFEKALRSIGGTRKDMIMRLSDFSQDDKTIITRQELSALTDKAAAGINDRKLLQHDLVDPVPELQDFAAALLLGHPVVTLVKLLE